MASRGNLMLYQGDDYRASVEISDYVTPPASVIAGYTAQAQIRGGPADSNPAILVEIATEVQSPYVNLTIPAASTAALNGKYVWDLQLIAPDGSKTTALAGDVIVELEVTRE
jgi:hypothetical protein